MDMDMDEWEEDEMWDLYGKDGVIVHFFRG